VKRALSPLSYGAWFWWPSAVLTASAEAAKVALLPIATHSRLSTGACFESDPRASREPERIVATRPMQERRRHPVASVCTGKE
jgi:hypothetical protein